MLSSALVTVISTEKIPQGLLIIMHCIKHVMLIRIINYWANLKAVLTQFRLCFHFDSISCLFVKQFHSDDALTLQAWSLACAHDILSHIFGKLDGAFGFKKHKNEKTHVRSNSKLCFERDCSVINTY